MPRIPALFFQQSTLDVARQLLGCRIVVASGEKLASGIIVETEAYLHEGDAACHAAKGKTKRNQVMFGPPGLLYVYSIHTRYCMNMVTEPANIGAAVLVRALQPIVGQDWMLANRPVTNLRELTNGPGKLCQAMGITTAINGLDLLTSPEIWLEPNTIHTPFAIQTTRRIGISQSTELPYRFFIDGSPFVSGRASDHRLPRTLVFDGSIVEVPQVPLSALNLLHSVSTAG